MRGMPTIHSSARPLDAAPPGLEQHVEALVGAQQPEEQHDRPVGVGGSSGGSDAAPGPPRVPRGASDAVGDHVHARGVDAELLDRRSRPCSECTTTASKRSYSRRWAARCPGRGSRGSTSWAVSTSGRAAASAGGQQVAVEVLDGEPLEVHDVGARARRAR